jgi:anthranilate synthase/aminodeoxychorismate synthase-like glutamine amidotransferase
VVVEPTDRLLSPGRVPLGVTRPVVFLLGGATADESTLSFVPTPRVLVIDSYDSFVYNLVQYLGELGADPVVVRNDELTVDDAVGLHPDAVLLSPGPGRPEDAGIICAAIPVFAELGVPVLGVCLGHQAIGHVFGATVERAHELMHGKTSHVNHDGRGVFAGLPTPLTATRYHSLVIDPATVPECLEVCATTDEGMVMGVRHRSLPIEGVQFHPESILTAAGHDLLRNFLARVPAVR